MEETANRKGERKNRYFSKGSGRKRDGEMENRQMETWKVT